MQLDIPIIAGSESSFPTWKEAETWISENSDYPVIVKAAMGGGGKGIRVVPSKEDLEGQFLLASNEARNAFGDGRCFVEKYVQNPRHIEVQCLGNGTGNVVHFCALSFSRRGTRSCGFAAINPVSTFPSKNSSFSKTLL